MFNLKLSAVIFVATMGAAFAYGDEGTVPVERQVDLRYGESKVIYISDIDAEADAVHPVFEVCNESHKNIRLRVSLNSDDYMYGPRHPAHLRSPRLKSGECTFVSGTRIALYPPDDVADEYLELEPLAKAKVTYIGY